MKNSVFQSEYAGHALRYAFTYPSTRYRFHPWPRPVEGEEYDIKAAPERLEITRAVLPPESTDAFVEYRSLIGLTAKELLKYDCCIFHCVSFLWKGRAFLLTAPSGTGKTTQYLNWQRLFPGEITMICGDMPVLERREDGSVWAHPTSWNGKENIGNRITAPLGGIVLLAQGKENRISPLPAREAILPFFEQFIVRPDTEEQIRALARLLDQMLTKVPCFKFVNLGDEASTALLRETLSPLTEGESHDL